MWIAETNDTRVEVGAVLSIYHYGSSPAVAPGQLRSGVELSIVFPSQAETSAVIVERDGLRAVVRLDNGTQWAISPMTRSDGLAMPFPAGDAPPTHWVVREQLS